MMMKSLLLFPLAILLACGGPKSGDGTQPAHSEQPAAQAAPAGDQPTQATTGNTSPEPSATAASQGPKASFTGTYWKLIDLNGTPMEGKTAKEMYLLFDPSQPAFKGHSGCNTLWGEFLRGTADQLRFTYINNTSMNCGTPDIEASLIQALEAVASYAIAGNTLTLRNSKGATILRLEAR